MFSPKSCTWKTGSVRTASICSKLTQTTIAVAMVCLSFAPVSQAQGGKGKSAELTGPAAEFHDRLRASLQGRTSAKIANPQAANFDNSAIIAVCRNQKQNADREARQLFGDGSVKPTAAMGDGSVRVADATKTGGTTGITDGSSQPAKPGGPAGNLPAVQHAKTRATGPGGGPVLSGPMKTESTSGNQSPGSSASNVTTASHAMCPPNISTISGLPTVMFSPSELFNPYTIKGCGFGNGVGKVYLTGPFNGGKVQLIVQSVGGSQRSPARAAWNDTAIIVNVDPSVTGEVDQENVTLVIEPASGAPIQKSGNQFLAARQDVTLQTIPKSAVHFYDSILTGVGGKKTGPLTPSGSTTATLSVANPELLYFTPSQSPAGFSAEVFRGGTASFFSTGSDLFDMSGLYRGFLAESFQLHQAADPTGCDSSTGKSEGNWSATWSGTNIRVSWKEFQCHLPWMGGGPDVWSDYSLSVTVKGPRGIDPWTGRRLLSLTAPSRTLTR
jgi:hypothetical protein